ncbi:Bacterial type II and III secretion system protein [Planctomycetes bacterium Pan216]|uniref:Bacterial type II and III secretion system protein n=1 Tax=Kolteria novifilia TaxID=2527975 RepID=A0A518B6B3_9BACT|nr:Bacterial type II and III secretion system protein [Planctomycetes bacterium Pan216]
MSPCIRGLGILAVVVAGSVSTARAQWAPQWEPVHGAATPSTVQHVPSMTMTHSTSSQVVQKHSGEAAWPYYSDSPLYSTQQVPVRAHAPQIVTSTPAAPVYPVVTQQAPAITHQQVIQQQHQPFVRPTTPARNPAAPIVTQQASATTFERAVQTQPQRLVQPTPPSAHRQAVATVTPPPNIEQVQPKSPFPEPKPATPPRAPQDMQTQLASFNQGSAPIATNQFWRDYPITQYTAKFPSGVAPEEGVRRWILTETGEESWYGASPTSLSVTPERVRVFHDDKVQQKVNDLLGRFLHYEPGQFQCKVRIWNVTEMKWREQGRESWRMVNNGADGRQAWYLTDAESRELIESLAGHNLLGKPNATLLAEPNFLVANGQTADVNWTREDTYVRDVSLQTDPTADVGYENQLAPANDDIELAISPLIAPDAASIDLDVDLKVHRLVEKHKFRLGLPGHPRAEVPETASAGVKERLRLEPGQNLLLSVGAVPSFTKPSLGRRLNLFAKNQPNAEVIVLISIVPAGPHSVDGHRIISAKPKPIATNPTVTKSVTKKKKRAVFHPQGLTPPVF